VVDLLAVLPSTGNALHSFYERTADEWRRPHLGSSVLGDKCDRALWYGWRWAHKTIFGDSIDPAKRRSVGQMMRLFERGHREEAWIVEDLRDIGVDVRTVDPQTGEQWRAVWHGGHVSGGADGVILAGLVESTKPHLLEVKTSNVEQFEKLLAQGAEKAKPRHWAQMQTLMRGLKLERAFYVCVCKDDDRIYTERVHLDRTAADEMIARAGRIAFANEAPARINENQDSFDCRFCDHRKLCHASVQAPVVAERNCRTCTESTPMPDGTWRCSLLNLTLAPGQQRMGCEQHLYRPDLLHWLTVVSADEQTRTVTYAQDDGKQITNRAMENLAL
jgi:hypothetical protein